jgi:hypothetical protein
MACGLVGVLMLQGCATDQAPSGGGPLRATPTEAFQTSDFAWSQAPGKGRIEGRLSFKNKGVAYGCAGTGVVLTPETPWTRRRMLILYNSSARATLPAAEVRGRTPPERSGDYSAFVKRATCDQAGQFAFGGLADGAWYVITVAKPATPNGGADMAIMRRVEVRSGKAVKVVL